MASSTVPRIVIAAPRALKALVSDLQTATGLPATKIAAQLGCSPQSFRNRKSGDCQIPVSFLLDLARLAGASIRVRFPF